METKTVKHMAELSHAASKALFRKILVALDGSESSERAAQAALELAEKLQADLIVLHAITPPASYYDSTIAPPTGMSLPAPSLTTPMREKLR
jgi:nucleotide-binding universal stress UspA family protein